MSANAADETIARGRLAKAEEFAEAAALFFDDASNEAEHGDAYVTLSVHAGIAASDVLCIRALGRYSTGDAHSEAVGLLRTVDPGAAAALGCLLRLKHKAGYLHEPVSAADIRQARQSHIRLLERARESGSRARSE